MKSLCRFCQKNSIKILFTANKQSGSHQPVNYACTNCGFGSHGTIVECGNCKIIYVQEKISQEKISAYYEVVDDPLYFAEQKAREKTFKDYLVKLEKYFPHKGKLLDVGTNTGLFVKVAKNSGWQALGLEPSKEAVRFAKKRYGLSLINKPFEKNTFPKESFNAIAMWDVIEHFTDPIEELQKVYWQLKPGGVFAFSTTDPKSLLAKIMGTKWSWYMDMHRVFFSREAAKFYLKKTGFKKVIFTPHWRYLSLGYLATRLIAVNPLIAKFSGKIIKFLGIEKMIVPYYANDLYDCYAFK
jgi:ubiquinone/menaquinone biosynthesis C-methylase UbiE